MASPYPGAYLAGLGRDQAPVAPKFFAQTVPGTTVDLWGLAKIAGALWLIGFAWKKFLKG